MLEDKWPMHDHFGLWAQWSVCLLCQAEFIKTRLGQKTHPNLVTEPRKVFFVDWWKSAKQSTRTCAFSLFPWSRRLFEQQRHRGLVFLPQNGGAAATSCMFRFRAEKLPQIRQTRQRKKQLAKKSCISSICSNREPTEPLETSKAVAAVLTAWRTAGLLSKLWRH